MRLDHPFVQLPIRFDADRLSAEVSAIEEAHWRPHPQGFPGNSMLPLVAVDGDPTNERFIGEMRATSALERCRYLKQVIASFGVAVGRTRLMRLAGHAEVTPHADQGYYWAERVRIHVPIVTQPSVIFECGGASLNMAAGECWIFDTWRKHRVLNDNDDQRIHLVCDTVGGAEFWSMVDKGRPHPGEAPLQGWAARLLPFDPDADPKLEFETKNIPEVMSPWELAAHLEFLLDEIGNHAAAPVLRRHVASLVRDWRALWAQCGDSAPSRRAYANRFEAFLRAIHPTASGIKLANDADLFGAVMAMVGQAVVRMDASQGTPVPA
jgi:hypothetical protein